MRAHERVNDPPAARRLAEAMAARLGPDTLAGVLQPGNHPALWPWRIRAVESIEGADDRAAMVVVTLRHPEGYEQTYTLQLRRDGR